MPNANRQATAELGSTPLGSRITLTPDEHTLKFFGVLVVWFATECGIVVRRDWLIEYQFWKDVPAEVKARMIHRLAVSTVN